MAWDDKLLPNGRGHVSWRYF